MSENILPRVEIQDLSHDGRGVGKVNGYTLFIPGALPGERVRARIIRRKKNYGEALIEEILDCSPHRRNAPCPVYSDCGGCQLQHLDYPFQVEFKRQRLIQALQRIAAADSIPPPGLFPAQKEWRYRNKATYHLQGNRAGFFSRESRRVVSHQDCLLLPQIVSSIKNTMAELLQKRYLEKGKNFTLRTSFSHEQQLLILDKKIKFCGDTEQVINLLREVSPGLKGIYKEEGKKKGRVIWGSSRIQEKMGNISFSVGPETFFQINPEQREVLLQRVREIVGGLKCNSMADLYAGAGVFALDLAPALERVMAVELSPEAVADGKKQAGVLGIKNVEFFQGEVEKVFSTLPRSIDCVILDPPREGCHPQVLQLMGEKEIPHIIYISCNPATLARDIGELQLLGYGIETLDLVDMFPQTFHVEAVAVLNKV